MGFGKPPFAMKLVLALGLLGAASSARAAYLYDMLDLGSLSLTLKNTHVSGINDAGQVVGWSYDNGTYRAFRTAPNAPINPATDDLGDLGFGVDTSAYAINDAGDVVGVSGHAFIYTGGKMYDINDLVPSRPAWLTLYDARGINNRGQIVVSGYGHDGIERAYLLTPIPEPGCLSLAFLGIFALRRRSR